MSSRKKALPAPLTVRLYAPGMTPLLRAGAGGLAASLRAILGDAAPWPAPVPLGPGTATVAPEAIHLDWGGEPPEATLRALFGASFQVRQGFIDLPGTRAPGAPEPPPALAAALHDALKVTFLQHGKSTQGGARRRVTFEVDAQPVVVESQGYESFVHQTAWRDVLKALESGTTSLASWAYPGAAERHLGVRVTKVEYTAAEALCACFALVGCVSYKLPQLRGGAFVALAPTDLVRFAELRPRLTPMRLHDVAVAGAADAVLAAQLVLAQESGKRRLGAVLGTTEAVALRQMPWNAQQKIRGAVVRQDAVREAVLDRYEAAAAALPHTLRVRKPEGKAKGDAGYFIATSALRAFITENLAAARPWYAGFATATTAEGRFIHTYRDRDNLGALLWHERKGLTTMHSYLGDAEQWLVQSVHLALRARFRSIYKDTEHSPKATRSNRLKGERERLRLGFAGAKTPEQVRAALADLWSRAGSNSELQEHWREVLPLLGPERWREARDLALVALASYQSQGPEAAELESADDESAADEQS
ncbi:type I-MYXAN CRISPR-associated Cas8a1/Cmx1 [Corallococcus macrosporus]|uniref:type I-MYXAN CRISPR-associated Cas8a1/Cmx1 n=1 Tax=Corallococcus macrosporus TaxID=35 RepID=UPI001EFD4B8D|nr:type I-MYXAN CRISPR-associated Cas8a1/Cmx1 [Corallococcus macrosporus]